MRGNAGVPVSPSHPTLLRKLLRRARNAWLRGWHGLRVRAESISPLEANDLFVAHLSIYHFAGKYAGRRRILDLGCGTGYGSAHLLEAGAREVIGVDLDARAVRFARRQFGRTGLSFRVADAQELPRDLGTFEVIVSSNVIEHLERVEDALAGIAARLAPGGMFLMVVPPITDERSLAENERNPFHRSNLFVDEWRARLERHFSSVRCFQHLPVAGKEPDFSSPFPSRLTPEDFTFREVAPEELARVPTLGAVFLCSARS